MQVCVCLDRQSVATFLLAGEVDCCPRLLLNFKTNIFFFFQNSKQITLKHIKPTSLTPEAFTWFKQYLFSNNYKQADTYNVI